jgi:hypothetical protein
MKSALRHWVVQVLIALDQLANALVPGGWADETLSSRAWRMWLKRKPAGYLFRWPIDILFWAEQRNFRHCQRSYEAEIERRSLPPSMRGAP